MAKEKIQVEKGEIVHFKNVRLERAYPSYMYQFWSVGKATFGIVINDEQAEEARKKDWFVRDGRPPRIPNGEPWLLVHIPFESDCELPPDAQYVDIDIEPYHWFIENKGGYKLYATSVTEVN